MHHDFNENDVTNHVYNTTNTKSSVDFNNSYSSKNRYGYDYYKRNSNSNITVKYLFLNYKSLRNIIQSQI